MEKALQQLEAVWDPPLGPDSEDLVINVFVMILSRLKRSPVDKTSLTGIARTAIDKTAVDSSGKSLI